MLADFRDYVKTLTIANRIYIGSTELTPTERFSVGIGKIDNTKEYAIGIYSMNGLARVEAFGLNSSYDVAGIRILVHWNRNAKDTEIASRDLYGKLRHLTNVTMGNAYTYIVEMDTGEPTFLGTDENGVYEYHIALRLYYKR